MSVAHEIDDTHVYHVVVEYSDAYMHERMRLASETKNLSIARMYQQTRAVKAGPFMRKASAKSALTSFKSSYVMRNHPERFKDAYIEESELVWKRV